MAGAGYSLIVRPDPVFSIDSSVYHPSSVYLQATQKQLNSLQNHTKITFDSSALTRNLQKQYPEIGAVGVELPVFGQRPKISLHIAPPTLVLSSSGQDYIIDKNGTVVTKAKNLPQIKNLPLLSDQSGFQTSIGKPVLATTEVSFISTLIKQCQRVKVPLAELILPPRAQELDLRTSDRPYFVKFYLGGDALLQTGQYLAARHQFDQAGQQPAQYLDVRVSGKVYYK